MAGTEERGHQHSIIVGGAPTFVPCCEERLPRARVAQPDGCVEISPVAAGPVRVLLAQPGHGRPLDRGGVLLQHGGNPPDTRQVGAPDVALVGESECAGRLGRDNLEDGGRELRAVGLAKGGEEVGARDRDRRGRRPQTRSGKASVVWADASRGFQETLPEPRLRAAPSKCSFCASSAAARSDFREVRILSAYMARASIMVQVS